MKSALIIHGAYGTPEENWFPWLKAELEQCNFIVHVPQLPTPENQNLESWLELISPYLKHLDNESIIIGHSIGATFILRLLEQLGQPVDTAILVAGFISDLPDSTLNQINYTFYNKPFNWEVIRHNAHRFILFHSPDDPFVPRDRANQLALQLHQSLIVIPNAGHFNISSGYKQFPELLDAISKT